MKHSNRYWQHGGCNSVHTEYSSLINVLMYCWYTCRSDVKKQTHLSPNDLPILKLKSKIHTFDLMTRVLYTLKYTGYRYNTILESSDQRTEALDHKPDSMYMIYTQAYIYIFFFFGGGGGEGGDKIGPGIHCLRKHA